MTCFPLGEVPPQAGIGVHFHRPKGGRFVFHRPQGRLFGFIQTGAPSFSKGATPRPLPPERSDAPLLYNPWHRGPSGPMDAICPSAAAGGHNPWHRGPSGPMDAICPSAAKGRRPLREYSPRPSNQKKAPCFMGAFFIFLFIPLPVSSSWLYLQRIYSSACSR